ncbi:hypothetical protein [Pelagicoccus sp. SDUM812002]|uniref:hypothetical protein n=1 Tax=Pelagicoccus sp. SDUM812002 TaxID=3041266 RepID=UPI00280F049A|nr:hypothetical protein [Pelagicoccus sp. SDUM812002]MDQ8188534.1 hypothetical protein [Pelagicoccus sp. SDUM812002]
MKGILGWLAFSKIDLSFVAGSSYFIPGSRNRIRRQVVLSKIPYLPIVELIREGSWNRRERVGVGLSGTVPQLGRLARVVWSVWLAEPSSLQMQEFDPIRSSIPESFRLNVAWVDFGYGEAGNVDVESRSRSRESSG